MAQYDGSIRIDTQIDQSGFNRGSRGLIQGMTRLGNSLRGLVGSLGFGLGIAGLIALGRQAINTASDIQEVQNVVDTAFGDMSYKMEELAKTSVKQFGISQLSAKEMGSTFMAMASNMVGSMETASDMAINLTKRAADMASFYNKNAEEVAIALNGIFTGETEVLKQYGIVQTEVNLQEFAASQGIYKKISAMTQAEKVQLRYNYVMQQSALAAGDFARTSDSWANQTRILTEQFKELAAVIGGGLIAALTPVVKFLNTILTMAIAVARQIGALLGKLFGISVPIASAAKGASDIASGMSDVADNADSAAGGAGNLKKGLDSAGKAAKKAGKEAKKSLAPFDKLNVLAKEATGADGGGSGKGGSGGGGGGAGGGGFQMPQVEMKEETEEAGAFSDALEGILKRLKELKDLFVAGFWDGLGDYKPILDDLKGDLQSIWKTLKEIFTDPEVVGAANRFFDSLAFASGQVVGSLSSIGLTMAANLIGGMEKYLTQNADRIKQYIISMFDVGSEIVSIIGNLATALADIFSVFAGDTAQQITGNIIGIFAEIGMMVSETALKLGRDILNMIAQPIIENKNKIKDAIQGTLEAIEPFTSGLLTAVQTVRDAVADIYDNHLKPLFDSIASGLSTILGNILDAYNKYVAPVLQSLGEKFKALMEGPFGKAVDSIAKFIGKLIDVLKILWETLLVPLFSWIGSTAMQILGKIVDILGNAFIKAAEIAFNVISKIADIATSFLTFLADHKGIIEAVGAALIGMFAANKIVSLANMVAGAIRTVSALIGGGGALSTAIAVAKGAIFSIIGVVQGVIGAITGGGGLVGAFSAIVSALGGPVTIAIGAVVAGLILLITHFDDVKKAVGKLKDWIVKKCEEISGSLKKTYDSIKKAGKDIIDKLISGIKESWTGFKEFWTQKITDIVDGFKDIKEKFTEKGKKIIAGIKSGIAERWSEFYSDWGEKKQKIIDKYNDIKEKLKAKGNNIISGIKSGISEKWSDFYSDWGEKKKKIIDKFEDIKDKFNTKGGKIISGIKSGISEAWSGFSKFWSDKKDSILKVFSNIGSLMENIGKNIVNGLINGIKSVWSKITGIASNIKDAITGAVSGAKSSVSSAGASTAATYSVPYSAVPEIASLDIPKLASGAVIRGGDPFMAVLGDQPKGQTNIETPLPTMMKAMRQVLAESGMSGGGEYTFVAQLDGKTIFKETVKQDRMHNARTGHSAFAH